MSNAVVAMILFLHSCHVQVRDSGRVEFVQKGKEKPEDELDPEWLQGAIEHQFCQRVIPPAVESGTASPSPEGQPGNDVATTETSEAAGSEPATDGDASDGAEPVPPKPAKSKKPKLEPVAAE